MRKKINGLFVSILVLLIIAVAFPAIVLAEQPADPAGTNTDYSSYVTPSTQGASPLYQTWPVLQGITPWP